MIIAVEHIVWVVAGIAFCLALIGREIYFRLVNDKIKSQMRELFKWYTGKVQVVSLFVLSFLCLTYTAYFGWNWHAKVMAEAVCDSITVVIMVILICINTKGKTNGKK